MTRFHTRSRNPHWLRFILSAVLFTTLFSSSVLAEPLIITYRSPESLKDKRLDYDNALLKLALEKTIAEYGDYQLVPSKIMNTARAASMVEYNALPNFFTKQSYSDTFSKNMSYIPFPIDLGIVGYRVCFVSPQGKKRLAQVTNLADLSKLVHGQGRGWVDTAILQHNGFTVKEVNHYESLFKMIAANRFDLFCRGVNEFLDEYETHKELKDLNVDDSMALAYPLPRFFYTHHSNKLALERITKGLLLAYQDGSLKKLWLANYEKSIAFSQLENRRIYHLENPLLKNIDFDFQQYFYQAQSKAE